MLFETVWFVNKAVYITTLLVILAIVPRLPYFVLVGALSLLLYTLSIDKDFNPSISAGECETENTPTACLNKGACFDADKSLDVDFEWSRYRRNVCMGVTANNERLLKSYSPENCALWDGCDREECTALLGKTRDMIKDFTCPHTVGDREKAMRLYQNTDEETALLFPGEDYGWGALPVVALGGISLMIFRQFVEGK